MINIQQFMEVELCVGVVKAAERVPDTDRLLKLQVDVGGEERQMVAGIAEVYDADELPGLSVVAVTNLEPATIRGVRSEGMVLAADVDGKPYLATFDADVPPGVRVR